MRSCSYLHRQLSNSSCRRLISNFLPAVNGVASVQPHAKRRLDAWIRAHDSRQRMWCSPRVERITVQYTGKFATFPVAPLQMTKGISAPIDCARHLSELLVKQSAIALVNGSPWDMHRPLLDDCELDFVHFKDSHNDPTPANTAFWHSSAFLLAATLESSFRPEHEVRLLSNPPLSPESGGFVCDISYTSSSSDIWLPSERELRALSTEGLRIATTDLPFEPLDANSELLQACFADEPLRHREVLSDASESSSSDTDQPPVCIYRLGSFVEACSHGPLITSTQLIGRFSVTSFRPLGWLSSHTPDRVANPRVVYRVQGVAIPTAFLTHFTTFDRLMQWARQPNLSAQPKPAYVVDF